VEAVLERDEPVAPCREPRELDRALVRLGPEFEKKAFCIPVRSTIRFASSACPGT
jgi:hypothetical protein